MAGAEVAAPSGFVTHDRQLMVSAAIFKAYPDRVDMPLTAAYADHLVPGAQLVQTTADPLRHPGLQRANGSLLRYLPRSIQGYIVPAVLVHHAASEQSGTTRSAAEAQALGCDYEGLALDTHLVGTAVLPPRFARLGHGQHCTLSIASSECLTYPLL